MSTSDGSGENPNGLAPPEHASEDKQFIPGTTDLVEPVNVVTKNMPVEVEMTSISVQSIKPKDGKVFCYTVDDLGAPQASKKDSLFDWQLENAGPKTIEAFGGISGLLASLGVALEQGLSDKDVADPKRLELYGNNKPDIRKSVGYWELIWDGLKDFTLIVLIIAAIVSMILGVATEEPRWHGLIDGGAILIAVLLVLNVNAFNDMQKDKQFQALNTLNNRRTIKVRRNGVMATVITDDLVAGDIVLITAGDTIPADGIYITGNNVKMDESKLTGESDQVEKGPKNPFIVSSSECHDGSCMMLIIAVGPNSVFGRMKTMIESDSEEYTPLQMKLRVLSNQISKVGGVAGVATSVALIVKFLIKRGGFSDFGGADWKQIVNSFIQGVTILVVAIPEGLPLAVTIALAYSVKKMMKDNNLVRFLSACETMGGASTICSDKTGTLTQGKMTVVQGWVFDGDEMDQTKLLSELKTGDGQEYDAFLKKCKELQTDVRDILVENAVLNNEGFLTTDESGREKGVGSALDVALLNWICRQGGTYKDLRDKYPVIEKDAPVSSAQSCIVMQYPFHSNRKRSSVLVHMPNGRYRLYVKGAPEMLVRICDRVMFGGGDQFKPLSGTFQEVEGRVKGSGPRKNIVERCIYPMARQALRVLAFAYRDFDEACDWNEVIQFATEEQKGVGDCPKVEDHLTLIGFLGFQDPVRPEVPEAVASCQKAGIFVRMVTGDNMETAKAIAAQCKIFAREGFTNPYGVVFPPGRALLGSQFRDMVGGLTLPPHFEHKCNCKDLSGDQFFVPDYQTPVYPVHFGYPSIVGHKTGECAKWTDSEVTARGGVEKACTRECSERGCKYRMKKPMETRELQQYFVVKNQGQFETLVDSLQVMARSAPTDKHMLVTGLMERRQVVAVTGDGTNDGPALAKANVGFAMGITGTSVAKDASKIVLMDDNFVSIVKAVMWGRNVYDSIRKFLQFQLTVNVVALVLAFVSAVVTDESPLKPVQLLWVNLIMDTFAALALATELPTPELLKRPPYGRDESLISNVMMRNILGQALFQFTLLMLLVFQGPKMFNVPKGYGFGGSVNTTHLTMIFNIFVFMQIMNEFNARVINNQANVFYNVFANKIFWLVIVGTVLVQFLIVEFAGMFMKTVPLTAVEFLMCILISFTVLLSYQLTRSVPGKFMFEFGGSKVSGGESMWKKLRATHVHDKLPSQATIGSGDVQRLKRVFTVN